MLIWFFDFQVVILSPFFLKHIAEHGRSELGKVFAPKKVLALLLGVEDDSLTLAHLSGMLLVMKYSNINHTDEVGKNI